jgi:ABC-type bacteriocin/lantibiotic exporter with double-glycine peptidase domain
MKKKLIESFIGSVVTLTIVVVITHLLVHHDVTLKLVLIDILLVLTGAGIMTLIDYSLLKKKNDKEMN